MNLIRTLLIAAILGSCVNSYSAPLLIQNPGFEDLYFGNLPPEHGGDVPATAFPTGPAPAGWSPFGAVGSGASIGVLNPGVMAVEPLATYFPAGAPEGDNVALMFFNNFQGGAEFGIDQTLADTLQPRTTYTLSVEVGNIASGTSVVAPYSGFGFFDLRGFPGYRIELLAGGVMIAQDDNLLSPAEGEFLNSTIQVDIGDSHTQLDQQLTIRLVNLNMQDVNDAAVDLEVDFDNVQLDASPLISADFDQDDDVDGSDFLRWQRGFGGGPLLSQGNADGDSDVDADDLLIWENTYSTAGALATSAIVPEPSTWLLALWCATLCAGAFTKKCRVRGAIA